MTDKIDAATRKAAAQLVAIARQRVGGTLYPRPEKMPADRYNSAIAALQADGLAHGGPRPNLTRAGWVVKIDAKSPVLRGKTQAKNDAGNDADQSDQADAGNDADQSDQADAGAAAGAGEADES